MAIFEPLAIGRNALLVQERALGVTGHNIANVNTPGYSRQRADLVSIPPGGRGPGRGVRIADIAGVVDPFVQARQRTSASVLAGTTTERDLLDRLQALFPVREGALGNALDDFFAAASGVANAPQDLAARGALLARADALAYQVRQAAGGLGDLQREIDGRLATAAADANGALREIAALNREIAAFEISGQQASDLRDRRELALQGLSRNLAVQVVERDDGTVDVFASGGQALVLGAEASTLAVEGDGTNVGLDGGLLSRIGFASPGGVIALAGELGGSIGALVGLRDDRISADAAALDLFATTLRDAVNAVQTDAAGRDLDGLQGQPFFAGAGAADLGVALTDPRGIAAARSANPGDNSGALALAAVGTTGQAGLGGSTLSEFFGILQSGVGERARRADDAVAIEENVAAALAAQRESVSGVSLEEEFTDLIRYQRAFQAAARLISVSDRMLDDLLGLVR